MPQKNYTLSRVRRYGSFRSSDYWYRDINGKTDLGLCISDLEDWFEFDKTDEITVTLSSTPIDNAYKVKVNWHKSKCEWQLYVYDAIAGKWTEVATYYWPEATVKAAMARWNKRYVWATIEEVR